MARKQTTFEKKVQKVRRTKNAILATAIIAFLGFHAALGYSFYSIYSGNDFESQMGTLETSINLTLVPTNLGQMLFDEIGFNPVIGPVDSGLFELMGALMGEGGDSGDQPPPESAQGEETTPEEQEHPEIMVLGTMAFMNLFGNISALSENATFLSKLNDAEFLAEYEITPEQIERIQNGSIDGSHLLAGIQVSLTIPLTITNPSFLGLNPGNISVAFTNSTTNTRIELINYQIPALTAGETTTVAIPISLTIPGSIFSATPEPGFDPFSAVLGDATDLTIQLTSSILIAYTIQLSATVDFAQMMMGGGEEDGDQESEGDPQ